MNNFVLKTIPLKQCGEKLLTHASELSTSKTVQDVCDLICENLPSKSKLESHLNLIHVVGNTGSGRTTFCKAVLKELIRNRSVKESEIIYIKINKHDNVDCVWNYGIQLAQELKNMGTVTSVLSSQSSSQREKEEAMVSIFNSFGVVSFDNLSLSETNHQLFTVLMSIVHKLKNSVIHISNKETPPPNHATTVQVHGFNHAAIRSNSNWKVAIQYLDANYKSINETVCINPLAVHLLLNASQIFGVLAYEGRVQSQTPVSDVLNMIWLHLSEHEKLVLFQLSQLRRALPLEKAEDLLRIIQIGLIEYESPGLYGNLFGQVTLNDSLKDFVLAKAESEMPLNKTNSNFDVFDCWKMLLCEELIGLIDEARNNAWPFVPEKWQYVKNVGQEESYNVKDLINMKVKNLPHLTQFDVLQETLHHAILKKDYESMAAILFIIDRYIYWQGGSKILLDIVDSIMKEKPELPIAPQIIIRKARVLRTSGDLQGAEKVLDKLLNEKQKLGTWHYKEEHHHDLVKAVCVQIKGEIQATLGQWYDSAVLLLDSIRLFKELPKVDKKGLSSSLGLCAKTLQHMSVEEFKIIAQRYFLKESHPYIQAYEFAFEAAEFAIYTPIFYARHKQSAGQMLLEYSKISVDKSKYLNGALKELKESLAAHKEYDALKSREQYHIFIIALYKISCVMEDMQLEKHLDLKITSMALFYHYSCNKTSIVHDSNSKVLINRALTILELPLYMEEMNPSETTGLSAPVAVGEINIKPAQTSLVDRCAGTLQALTLGQSLASTVDRSKATVLTIDDLTGSDMTNYYDYLNESIDTLKSDNVHECKVSSYDAVKLKWKDQKTIIYIGEQLNLSKDDEGVQRNPYMVEYLGQDEPMGKYVGKRYKKPLGPQQYKEDVRCQMTARYYVGLFNQDLYHKGIEVSHIQFLPVVMVTLLTPNAGETSPVVYNVEPYMQGKFIKLTNNWAFVEEDVAGSQLVLAFSHFTYERSNKTLLITDHQGWTSEDHLSTTFLTDPQIHSVDKKLYGTGNLGMRGINKFWKSMHPECNEICKKLSLTRP